MNNQEGIGVIIILVLVFILAHTIVGNYLDVEYDKKLVEQNKIIIKELQKIHCINAGANQPDNVKDRCRALGLDYEGDNDN